MPTCPNGTSHRGGGPGGRQIPVCLLGRDAVTAPIVGARTPEHLRAAVAAVDTRLTAEETEFLEAPYQPHPVVSLS